MGQHGSISTELRLRADDLKHLVRPQYVKGLTRADVGYGRPMFGAEPLHGQEVVAVVRRFRHHINGSGALLSDHWEALTYDLAAVHGTIGSGALRFGGVSTHLFDRFLNGPARANDASWHLFVLGPGELVRGVDLSWRDHDLVGLRVQTNQRQSQWFGQRLGVVKAVTAPQGYFVNAIEELGASRNELALRLCPVTEHLTRGISMVPATPAVANRSPCVGGGTAATTSDGVQTAFAESRDEVRAVVVKCGARGGIEDLHVLSPELFGRHLAKREEPLPTQEHLLFLRFGEFLTEVEVVAAADKVLAMRFHTNLTKSAWFGDRTAGESDAAEATSQSLRVPDKATQICGFHGSFGEKFLSRVGVVFQSLPAERERHALVVATQQAHKTLD